MSRRNHRPDRILRRTASADIGLGEQRPPRREIRAAPDHHPLDVGPPLDLGEQERRSSRARRWGGVLWRTGARVEARRAVLPASARAPWAIGHGVSALAGAAERARSRSLSR